MAFTTVRMSDEAHDALAAIAGAGTMEDGMRTLLATFYGSPAYAALPAWQLDQLRRYYDADTEEQGGA
ncbi:MAG TPA: hypothetical protein VGW38_09250 [Chloroflexota bacterium]|nr:hypothetical protein [Chloroflexota bacterium]